MKNTKVTRGKLFLRRLSLCAAVTLILASAIFSQESNWDSPLATCWSRTNENPSSISAASDNTKHLYLPKSNRNIQSLSAPTGSLEWTIEYGGQLVSPIFFHNGQLLFAVRVYQADNKFGKLRIFTVNTQSGISNLIGEFPIDSTDQIAFNGESVVKITTAGRITAYSTDAKKRWDHQLSGGQIVGAAFVADVLSVFGSEGRIWLVGMHTGREIQEYKLPSRASGAFKIDRERNRFYAGAADGNVYALDLAKGGTHWTSRTGGAIDSISLTGSDLLVTSSDNFVYRLADGNGRRLWKRRLAGRILGSVLLSKEFGAFVSLGTVDIVILRLSDGKVVNRYEVQEGNYFTAPPIMTGGRLVIQTDTAVTAVGPASLCPQKQNEDAKEASSF